MGHHEEEPTHASVWLYALLRQYPRDNCGQLYVERFAEACDHLLQNGEITAYKITTRNSPEDGLGIDAFVTRGAFTVPFQITSTKLQVDQHREVHQRHTQRPPVHFLPIREGNRHTLKPVYEVEREIRKRIESEKYR